MALSCRQVQEWIEQALDGTLDLRHERPFRRHLQRCVHCERQYRLERLAVEGLRSLPEVDLPAGLTQRVMAALPDFAPQLLGRLAEVLQQAMLDDDLRRRLREDPQGTLFSLRVALPPGVRVEVITEQPAPLPTAGVLYLPLPEKPLRLEEMEQRLAAMGLGPLFGFWG